MYEARKIANYLLYKFDARTFDITNMKMNKVLFFIHGWGYVRLNRKLIRNHFVAWDYGPVVRSVWESFREFESNPITRPAKFINYGTGKTEVIGFQDLDAECTELIKLVAPFYISKSSSELVSLTHRPNSPWKHVRDLAAEDQTMFQRIPDDLIRDYFFKEFGGRLRH